MGGKKVNEPYILRKHFEVLKENFSETIWFIELKVSGIIETVMFFQSERFLFYSLHQIMMSICKQGKKCKRRFAYIIISMRKVKQELWPWIRLSANLDPDYESLPTSPLSCLSWQGPPQLHQVESTFHPSMVSFLCNLCSSPSNALNFDFMLAWSSMSLCNSCWTKVIRSLSTACPIHNLQPAWFKFENNTATVYNSPL